MESRGMLGLLAVTASLTMQTTVWGISPDEDAAPPPPAPTMQELIERIERLEQDKVRMGDEMDELRVQVDEDWMTEARASQIREIVGDVLADADSRTSLQDDGINAGWDGKFFLQSGDGRFRLNVSGQIQLRWMWSYHDGQPKYRYGFENARTQIFLDGHMFTPDLTYRLQGDFANGSGAFVLQDAWVRYQLTNEWSIRGGQYLAPFMREQLIRSWNQQAVERSLVSNSLSTAHTQGIELQYANRDMRWVFSLDDGGTDQIGGFGIAGSNPQNSPALSQNTEYSFHTRYEYKIAGGWEQFHQFTSPPGTPFGLLVGGALHVQRNNPGVRSTFKDETEWLAGTVDVTSMWGGANLFGAVTWHYVDGSNANFNVWGAVIQAGTYFTDKLEGFARFEYGQFHLDGDPFFEDLATFTIGTNYYFDGQDVKFSADIGFGINAVETAWDSTVAGWRVDAPGEEPQVVIRTQLQLLF